LKGDEVEDWFKKHGSELRIEPGELANIISIDSYHVRTTCECERKFQADLRQHLGELVEKGYKQFTVPFHGCRKFSGEFSEWIGTYSVGPSFFVMWHEKCGPSKTFWEKVKASKDYNPLGGTPLQEVSGPP